MSLIMNKKLKKETLNLQMSKETSTTEKQREKKTDKNRVCEDCGKTTKAEPTHNGNIRRK